MNARRSPHGKIHRIKCNCLHCKELFTPDPRNIHHQVYCSKPECRKASKSASHRKWLSSEKGAGYFTGKDNTDRVREWRKSHPGYWRRASKKASQPLQDHLTAQVIENSEDNDAVDFTVSTALQDLCFLQPALFIGLISSLTGNTLQDDIVRTARRMIVSGQDILGGGAISKNTQ